MIDQVLAMALAKSLAFVVQALASSSDIFIELKLKVKLFI